MSDRLIVLNQPDCPVCHRPLTSPHAFGCGWEAQVNNLVDSATPTPVWVKPEAPHRDRMDYSKVHVSLQDLCPRCHHAGIEVEMVCREIEDFDVWSCVCGYVVKETTPESRVREIHKLTRIARVS